MPKRTLEESKEERWQRKLKKYETKLKKKRTVLCSDDNEQEHIDEELEPEPDEEWYPSIDESPVTEMTTAQCPAPAESPAPAPIEACPSAGPVEQTETSDAANAAVERPDVDPELLKALGTLEEDITDWGEPIVDHIAMRLKPLLLKGFKKDDKDTLIKKYPFPKNLTLAKAPTLNAEISAMLSEPSRNRDKRLCVKQNQLGAVLSGVTKAMSLLLCKEPKIVGILSILSDASKLLADSHYLETDTRRSLITPLIDKELIDPFKDRKRDEYLFGENLGEMVKNSRGIKKTGQLIQAIPPANLNPRGPSSRGRQQKTYPSRGGGQQRPYRRRAASYPQPVPYPYPAATVRRQPLAQPAPRRPPPAPASSAPRPSTSATTTGSYR